MTSKTQEEEFFAKQEIETKRAYSQKIHDAMASNERIALKALHYMHCPKCGMGLQTVQFRGINIDKCFNCLGVFLDNGELETLAGKEHKFVDSILQLFKV